jgi:SHS2 domain-containing protein
MSSSSTPSPHVKAVQYEYLDHTADIQLHAWGATLAEAFEQVAVAMFGYMTDLETVGVDDAMTVEFAVGGGGDDSADGGGGGGDDGGGGKDGERRMHDLKSLLYAYLDELLFRFSTEEHNNMIVCAVEVLELVDDTGYVLRPHCCCSDRKACTHAHTQHSHTLTHTHTFLTRHSLRQRFTHSLYSGKRPRLRCRARGERFDCGHLGKHTQGTEVKAITYSNMQINRGAERTDLYVIVDI